MPAVNEESADTRSYPLLVSWIWGFQGASSLLSPCLVHGGAEVWVWRPRGAGPHTTQQPWSLQGAPQSDARLTPPHKARGSIHPLTGYGQVGKAIRILGPRFPQL